MYEKWVTTRKSLGTIALMDTSPPQGASVGQEGRNSKPLEDRPSGASPKREE